MENQTQLDILIRKSLDNKAHEINVLDNMSERVKTNINSDMKKSTVQRFMRRTAEIGLLSKRQAAMAAMLLLIVSMAAVYSFNPHVKAWAEKKASDIINTISITLPGDGSYTKSSEKTITVGEEMIQVSIEERVYENDVPMVDIKEVENTAGFKVKLPEYLPDSLNLPDRVSVLDYSSGVKEIEDSSDNIAVVTDANMAKELMKDIGKINVTSGWGRQVKIKLNDAKNQFDGLCLLTVSDSQFINMHNSQGKVVGILDRTATLYENDVILKNESQSQTKKVSERILEWKDGDAFYRIDDYSGLGVDELVKIVESIIKKP
ncbi:hypothetical protein [Pseudobacteroides cellulosolvens]|uniref:DUF4367 domain-containing protein n=1 Tax=Pseudobacteroides cellulosolvens ATCC 35603 = DSM 2933 TaxID=398512 RepID=A0A0L6JUC7_9FIRM|nr:hypothetical protein [Pseudobacteroides cellulosolvens]KNY29250.1 hypothetical protein Bccel_4524 [Pseudobacteroides cellulosolvens ATCC 35603 = DSM 2933]